MVWLKHEPARQGEVAGLRAAGGAGQFAACHEPRTDALFEEVAAFIRQNEAAGSASRRPTGATGRYLHCVEAWIRWVRPLYANSHTAVSLEHPEVPLDDNRTERGFRGPGRVVTGVGVSSSPDLVALHPAVRA